MEETVELVRTKTYTVEDIIALLGEGYDPRAVRVSVSPGGDKAHWFETPRALDTDVLRVVIREPHDPEPKKP